MSSITVERIAQNFKMQTLTPDIDLATIAVGVPEISRPALQLTGYYDNFVPERIQLIGYMEFSYLMQLEEEERYEQYDRLVASGIPCMIFTARCDPDEKMIAIHRKYGVPVLVTDRQTTTFLTEIMRWLTVELAPKVRVHGVLVDIFGEGVLIMGESGIGKSEAALELIHRGHRLVSDDVVEIRKVSDETLVGTAPELTRHLIELRGIGIIDVKMLYGVEHVKETSSIDLVIRLEDWDRDKEYDRLGLVEEYTEFLGNRIVCHTLPIRPGRNLAIIAETAAVNRRQKKMGYNAAQELYRRMQENLSFGQE